MSSFPTSKILEITSRGNDSIDSFVSVSDVLACTLSNIVRTLLRPDSKVLLSTCKASTRETNSSELAERFPFDLHQKMMMLSKR